MSNSEVSKILKIAAKLVRYEFDHIEDLDLPKNFGKRRYRKLGNKIYNHNDYLKRLAIELRDIAIPTPTKQQPVTPTS